MISQTFKILLLILITPVLSKKVKLGPHWDHRERTTCEEFGQYARFNPQTMTKGPWFVFYYWAPQPDSFNFHFDLPTKNVSKNLYLKATKVLSIYFLQNYTYLHKCLDNRVAYPVNWTAKHVMLRVGADLSLLVELGDRGQYLMYNVKAVQNLHGAGRKLMPLEVRMKQTGDNKIVGMMVCKKETVYALARMKELPRKNELQDAAGRLNYRSRGGKSYLYQGTIILPLSNGVASE
ncbi:uncharacterized protein LOC133529324 [Cydia pomonella]|uniref:uncharacterized protein LOC133529324 n=1 Tax=Cydia pomonella TaxID=82600 RepID=UPI002ADDB551|nr:uncharacterized protein LOC133529324 [Cydia pomonella]